MSTIFISHSSVDNAAAIALRGWLSSIGCDDVFLDIDPERGLVAGQRWLSALHAAGDRCRSVLFLVSSSWLKSQWCRAELSSAIEKQKVILSVIVDDTPIADLPPELSAVWQVVDLKGGRTFEQFTTYPPPHYQMVPVSFSAEGLKRLKVGVTEAGMIGFAPASFEWPPKDQKTRSPFRGLLPFEAADAGVFFGRDSQLVRARETLAALRETGGRRLFAILSASGAGKSSFLRAGILPRLERTPSEWFCFPILRPRQSAISGEGGLVDVLHGALARSGIPRSASEVRSAISKGTAPTLELLESISSKLRSDSAAATPTFILPIDRGEELFAAEGIAESEELLGLVASLLRHGPEAIAVMTIRSDSYDRVQSSPALLDIAQAPFNLPPVSVSDYRQIIEGPVERLAKSGNALEIEPALSDRILKDLAEDSKSDALPLLALTLERMAKEYSDGKSMTVEAYEKMGGIGGVISEAVRTAVSAFRTGAGRNWTDAQVATTLRSAFVPWLARINMSNEAVRRIAFRTDFEPESLGLIDAFVQQRLLVTDMRQQPEGPQATVEVAHETLLRRWPDLASWLDYERARLRLLEEVLIEARSWEESGRRDVYMRLMKDRLADAQSLLARKDYHKALGDLGQRYIQACREHEATQDDYLKSLQAAAETSRRQIDQIKREYELRLQKGADVQFPGGDRYLYRSFISYSHVHSGIATRYRTALEGLKVPTGVPAEFTEKGVTERRLGRIFQDREELSAAAELGQMIDRSLKESATLIVFCDNASARSRWSDGEIQTFRRIKSPDRIVAILTEDPSSGDYRDVIPPALRDLLLEGDQLVQAPAALTLIDARKMPFQTAVWRTAAAILGANYQRLEERRVRDSRKALVPLAFAGLVVENIIILAVAFQFWKS